MAYGCLNQIYKHKSHLMVAFYFWNQMLEINKDRIELDEAYMRMAEIWAKRSKANRLQVGALIVKNRRIISDGYNGMPSGAPDDVCEFENPDGTLTTKPEVLHAESNALMKLVRSGGESCEGSTMYVTDMPCESCAKLIIQAGVSRVIYRRPYRIFTGVLRLREYGVEVIQLE